MFKTSGVDISISKLRLGLVLVSLLGDLLVLSRWNGSFRPFLGAIVRGFVVFPTPGVVLGRKSG